MSLPLEGIVVLEVSRVLAGPYLGMQLADMGAEVIKIEMPKRGDEARFMGPFVNNESAYFMSVNRNKRSLTLDLKHPEGKELFLRLARKADVILENNRPRAMARLGLDYKSVREINPRIIYVSVSGFGHSGPYKDKPAFDIIVQAMGGVMSITGQPGGLPTRVGTSIGDLAAGVFGALGVLSALFVRERTGEGQHIDVSMLDCQVALLENAVARYFATGESPVPMGNRHPSIAPFSSLPTSNGHIIVAAGNDKLWQQLCLLLGSEELVEDPRFNSIYTRTENWDQLEPLLSARMKMKSTEEWQKLLDESEIPCAPIYNMEQMVKDPHIKSRNMIVPNVHPVAGAVNMINFPLKYSATPCQQIRLPAPLLGEHSRSILQEYLGCSTEDLDALEREGVI